MENLEELKREIFNWAVERGQEHVAIEITRMWFRMGGNTSTVKLHQMEDPMGNADWRAINNNRQQIFRWLRGDTKAATLLIQQRQPLPFHLLAIIFTFTSNGG
ncbi:toxin YdaT family protein [Enterobacter kobei]|uniref:toxin YdaT family protein n=1 Tax=Enterobacter kobei TaxID=208224 RepID=UPI003076327E